MKRTESCLQNQVASSYWKQFSLHDVKRTHTPHYISGVSEIIIPTEQSHLLYRQSWIVDLRCKLGRGSHNIAWHRMSHPVLIFPYSFSQRPTIHWWRIATSFISNTGNNMSVKKEAQNMELWQTFWFAWKKPFKMVILCIDRYSRNMAYEQCVLYFSCEHSYVHVEK